MQGYWRKPEMTASVMLEGGWLRTGDGGSFDEDGYLYLHDRIKDMIISGGENIYPAEVESALTAHPDILEVAVIGVPSAEWGESPHAVVVLRAGSTLDETTLIEWSRGHLAHFKCPASVTFTDSLPRTASGKLQKVKLRAQH
jgi:acyl-CoA synthetase (AMP-forming)/AMP-acid ligase II